MKTKVDTDVLKQSLNPDSTAVQALASGNSSAVNQVAKGIKNMKIKDTVDRSSVSHTRNERLTAEPRQRNQDLCPYRGLRNQGATCYLNATLQVLFMTEPFRERVLRGTPSDTSEKLVSALKELFEELSSQDGGAQSVSTKGVIKALGIQNVYEQQDAVEYFLDILEKAGPNLAEVFSGTMRNNRVCSEGHTSHDDSSFKSIQIALNTRDGPYRLVDGVHSYFASTKLVGDDQMYCETCDDKSDTTWSCEIHEYPTILALHLKRFVYDYRSYRFEKNECPMDVPLHLSLWEHKYSLYAVINHMGSRYGGHYTADIRSSTDDKWYYFNDSYVTQTNESKLERSMVAYLLLYQKIDSPPAYEMRKETQNSHAALTDPRTEHLLQRSTAPSSSVACVEDVKEEKTAEPGEPVEKGSSGQCAGAHNKPQLEGVSADSETQRHTGGQDVPQQNNATVARIFPGHFGKNFNLKRRLSTDKYMETTPKAAEELAILQPWLDSRTISIIQDAIHSLMSCKMAGLKGAWMLSKDDGGSGQSKPPESEGYTCAFLIRVAGGKQTLYIVPGSLDTSPLPYSAKEFEKMPKATWQICLDSSTNKQNENFRESPDNRDLPSTSTAMDIMLKNVPDHTLPIGTSVTTAWRIFQHFDPSDFVKINASFCGERLSHGAYDTTKTNSLHDTDGTEICPKRFKAHREIKSITDVIKSLAEKVDKTSDFSICITRDRMLETGLKQWQQQKKSSPKNPLRVTFTGEAGIDNDTLRKEFLTEMVTGIEKQFFEGGENGKTPKYSMTDMEKYNFKTVGEIFAVSITQGGPTPNFFMEWCYNYISTGEMDLKVITERDVTDPVLMELIKEIKAADHTTLMECKGRIFLCGYTGEVSIQRKKDIVRSVVLHAAVRLLPMLQQICSGMKLYGLLTLVQEKTDICRQLFVPASFTKKRAKTRKTCLKGRPKMKRMSRQKNKSVTPIKSCRR